MFRAAVLVALSATPAIAQDVWPRIGTDGKPVPKAFRFKPKAVAYLGDARLQPQAQRIMVRIEDKGIPADTFSFTRTGTPEAVKQQVEDILAADDGHLTVIATWVNMPTPENAASDRRVLLGELKVPTDLDLLRGNWQVVSFTFDGRPLPPDRVAKMSAAFTDKTFTLRDGTDDETGTIKLDTNTNPKHVDLTAPSGAVSLAIYEVKGTELRLAWRKPGSKRPAKFDPAECDGLMVLKRARK